ncbi:hypothetical protein PTTG_09822, partial [Puccinia triticina 1-1 BBBD Race 1]|uniref:Uncharacterized protein n=1 Tax=Puccinia triticina (isolate 1-1 / race 1 (BBBD)) TaxID=630390 RepID=A0A0C4F9E6_PUCT1
NKAGCYGYGVVVSKVEEKDDTSATTQFNNLLVKIRHTDYDIQTRTSVSFLVQYKVAGNRNLAKTFGLFQVGREVMISGHVAGYSINDRMLQVNALSVSVSSGSTPASGPRPAEALPLTGKTRRPLQIDFESEDEKSDKGPTTAPTPGGAQQEGPADQCKPANNTAAVLAPDQVNPSPKKRKYTKRSKQLPEEIASVVTPETSHEQKAAFAISLVPLCVPIPRFPTTILCHHFPFSL